MSQPSPCFWVVGIYLVAVFRIGEAVATIEDTQYNDEGTNDKE